MRYFLDNEFHEDGRTIIPISVAVVAADGREFYRCNSDYDQAGATPWLKEHVLPQLPEPWEKLGTPAADVWVPKDRIGQELRAFVGDDPTPEFWGYYADYDWVLIAQLFGPMIDLPKPFPMFCLDVKQYLYHLGNPWIPKQTEGVHNALCDARWIRDTHRLLETFERRTA